jgi:hypothetical protein
MRIDVHAHYWTEKYIDLLVDLGLAGAVVRAIDYVNDPQIDPDAARAILDHNASALLGIGG